uniref:RNase H type-1 domain-containing protein n=1 Tax=Nicotiana tabacum TaxID=4097 RepID=A0A1S3XE00_TOBAC
MGMNMAVDLDAEELLIMGDSDLIIRQAQGEWKTRAIKLIPYMKHVEDLSKRFKSAELKYIPRFHNELADALATLASMLPYPGNAYIDPLEIQIRERHGYCNAIKMEPDVQP